MIGFVGAKVAVQPDESRWRGARRSISSPRNEFDFTCLEVAEGRPFAEIDGITWRNDAGELVNNKDRAILEDMDQLPFVTEVYKRDLRIEDYFIGYLKHPYISMYTGPRLQEPLHLLPVAADGRRAPLPRPQPGARGGRDPPAMADFPAGEGVLLRRRYLHRQPAAGRGDCQGTRQARRDVVLQRQGQRAVRHA